MSDSRAEFETFISLPPHEKEILRFPDDGSSAWPGSYKKLIVDLAWDAWQASRQALEGEAIGYVVPRMLEAMLAGKYCGISMSAEPKEDGIAVYTHPASDDATECPYPCGWSDLQSIAIRKAAFIARSAEDDIGTPFEDIRQAGSELGRIAIKLCSLAIKQEQKS